jgi:hypothetical protein
LGLNSKELDALLRARNLGPKKLRVVFFRLPDNVIYNVKEIVLILEFPFGVFDWLLAQEHCSPFLILDTLGKDFPNWGAYIVERFPDPRRVSRES